jgi:hypothetical protein
MPTAISIGDPRNNVLGGSVATDGLIAETEITRRI